MQETAVLMPYHQSRWVCLQHGFFDVRLAERPPASYRARCPDCERPAEPREGFECCGKTTNPIPFRSKPRLDEVPELELGAVREQKVIKNRRGYYDRHTKTWKNIRR